MTTNLKRSILAPLSAQKVLLKLFATIATILANVVGQLYSQPWTIILRIATILDNSQVSTSDRGPHTTSLWQASSCTHMASDRNTWFVCIRSGLGAATAAGYSRKAPHFDRAKPYN